jgi:F-type H+-transporting ATPase subunit a
MHLIHAVGKEKMLMSKKKRVTTLVIMAVLVVLLIIGIVLTNTGDGEKETIKEVMRDAVLHESNKVSLFGLMDVNPGLISAYTVTAIILVFALIVRLFVIPRFKMVPGKFQLVIEELVSFFDNLAKTNSPHKNGFLGAYIFAAGCYIFVGTIFELFGLQVITTKGTSMAMPAPLSDINGAIALGCLSYLIILSGGIAGNGFKGVGQTLKDFSLPISMSFRLFGALLSGLLVTEMVYYYITLSFVLPVIVGILFTLLHALIQTYVLTMLTSVFYGEVSEPSPKKEKKKAIGIS